MLVCLYARVSTTRQADNDLSIPDQLNQMREWCEKNNHAVVREYVEPGASATDDRRPIFQQMIANAQQKPAPFSVIVIHSLSRFFRDVVEFGVYERKLLKQGVKIISITQQTSEDSAGEMARRMFSMFDEYQSKETSKHTSRAMKENARQGYWNGSRPPYGYKAVESEVTGGRGRKKKVLQIDKAEATTVKRIFDLYLHGYKGRSLGMTQISKHLNERNQLHRGVKWRSQTIQKALSNTAYIGEHYFNKTDSKTRRVRPMSEWILLEVPPIVDRATFERVRVLRESRSPEQTAPRLVNNPSLLTGLLRCGHCGAQMTRATGKGGRYEYYKCTTRLNRGAEACDVKNIRMETFDELVLDQLISRVLTPDRLRVMLAELRKRAKTSKDDEQQAVKELEKHLKDTEQRLTRLYGAIETGAIELDETLSKRVQKL